MQYTPADDRRATSSPTHGLRLSRTRIGYTLAGAFAFVGTAAAVHAATTPGSTANGADSLTLHQTTSQMAPAGSASADTPTSSSPNNHASSSVHASVSASGTGAPDVQLQVNGQNIPVPANGTTQQTVTSTDGSQTSVKASSNVSSAGDASNSSTTMFSLNVTSNSSTGGTTAN